MAKQKQAMETEYQPRKIPNAVFKKIECGNISITGGEPSVLRLTEDAGKHEMPPL